MNTLEEVLQALRLQYAKHGTPHAMNEVQATNYLDELRRFDVPTVAAAAKQWIRQSAFFPAISDLLGLLDPPVDPEVAAKLAWSDLEQASRRYNNSYGNVRFEDPVMGEAVKRTFGTWSRVVLMDQNEPMWASRRNVFLALYPSILAHPPSESPLLVGHFEGKPSIIPSTRTLSLPAATVDRTQDVLDEATRRFKALRQQQNGDQPSGDRGC